MVTELVVRLRASGSQDVEAALAKIGQAAQDAGVKLQPVSASALRLSDHARFAVRAVGDLAQTLAGTSALLSIIGRENKAVQDAFEKVTVALSLTSVAMNIFRNITQLSVVNLHAFRAALAAALGPVGIAVAALASVVALAAGIAVLVRRHLEAKEAAEKQSHALEQAGGATAAFERSVAASVETAKAAGFIYSQLTSDIEHFSRMVRESLGAIQGLALETKGLLGPDLPSFRDLGQEATDAAAAAKTAAAAFKKAREELARLQEVENATNDLLLADAAMRQADEAALALSRSFGWMATEAKEAASAARDLATAADPLITLANSQAVEAIEDHMQAQRDLAAAADLVTKALQGETDALVGLANSQAVEAIEAHMEAQRQVAAAADAAAAASRNAAETARQAWVSTIGDIIARAQSMAEVLTAIWEYIKQTIIRKMAEALADKVWSFARGFKLSSILPPPFNWIAGIFGLQHGGIVTKPTLAMIGEAGPEAVIPLHSPSAATAIGGGNQYHIHIHGATFLGSREDVRRWFQGVARPVFSEEYAR